jgi:predicted nucleic acid-binding protein
MADSSSVEFRLGRTRLNTGYLIDTGILLAIATDRDPLHHQATECLRLISERRYPVLISLPTIYETHRRILYDVGIDRAREFLDSIFDGSITVVAGDPQDESEGIRWIDSLYGQKVTLTDAVNMAIMQRLELRAVVSFDVHFRSAGFECVPPI